MILPEKQGGYHDGDPFVRQTLIASQANDFAMRALSERERRRVSTALDVAALHMQHKLRLGYELRADGFVAGSPKGGEFLTEIAEGVLIAAQRQHEERKIRHLGYLLANLAFDEIDRQGANLLIRYMSTLSYTQLCLLAAFSSRSANLRSTNYYPDDGNSSGVASVLTDILGILTEVDDLWRSGLVFLDTSIRSENKREYKWVPPAPLAVIPSDMRPWGMARVLIELAELNQIDDDDLRIIEEALRVDLVVDD